MEQGNGFEYGSKVERDHSCLAKRVVWIQRGFRVELNCGLSEHIDNERDSMATWKSVLLVPSVTVEQ